MAFITILIPFYIKKRAKKCACNFLFQMAIKYGSTYKMRILANVKVQYLF